MPTFKRPPKLTIEIDLYLALVVAQYLRLGARHESAPTLSGMLDAAAGDLLEAVQRAISRIRSEHLIEQSEAHLQEMLRGVDRIWEDTMEADGGDRPLRDEGDPEPGEDRKDDTP
jgi:hypothetical protein